MELSKEEATMTTPTTAEVSRGTKEPIIAATLSASRRQAAVQETAVHAVTRLSAPACACAGRKCVYAHRRTLTRTRGK